MNLDDIKQQQAVLKHLGYYSGAIDGYWSIKTMEAKIEFERSGKFNPCISNGGKPFNMNSKLPQGLYVDEEGKLAIVGVELKPQPVVEKKVETATTPVVEPVPVIANVAAATTAPTPVVADRNYDRNKNNKHQQSAPQPAKPPVATNATEVSVKLDSLK